MKNKVQRLLEYESFEASWLYCVCAETAITCSKLTIETLEQGVNFGHISHLALVFILLTFEQASADRVPTTFDSVSDY